MESTAFDGDSVLTNYLTDYVDSNLERSEIEVFEEYLDQNKKEQEFARKVKRGKQALSWLSQQIDNSKAFRRELALNIALNKKKSDKSDLVSG